MSQNDGCTSPSTLSNDSTESESEDIEDFSSSDNSTLLNVSQEKSCFVEAVWEDVEDSGTNEGLSKDSQYPSPALPSRDMLSNIAHSQDKFSSHCPGLVQ
jgi:hypothetical protein